MELRQAVQQVAPGRPIRETSRPLRIGVIGTRGIPSSYSGLESIAESLYTVLAERGHEVTVYARGEYLRAKHDVYRGVRVVRAPFLRRKSVETLSHAAASLAHALSARRYDVLHLHAIAPGMYARACRMGGVPTLAWVQGLDWQRAKWAGIGSQVIRLAEREMVRNVDDLMVVSRDLQRYYQDNYGRRADLVPNGVTRTHAADARAGDLAAFGLEAGNYLLFVGRIVPEKRIHDLIQAFAAVDTTCRLAIVGEGGYTDAYVTQLRTMAEKDPRVVFTGLQSDRPLHSLFQYARAYVHPSELEGMPLALLECLDHGVPAIASDIPAHREVLDPVLGYNLFFPPGDVAALTERIERVLARRQEYLQLAGRAQRHVRVAHAWSTVADRIEEISRRAIARREAVSARR